MVADIKASVFKVEAQRAHHGQSQRPLLLNGEGAFGKLRRLLLLPFDGGVQQAG